MAAVSDNKSPAGDAGKPHACPEHHTGSTGSGRFRNPWPSFAGTKGFLQFLSARLFDWRSVKIPTAEEMPNVFPSVKPDFNRIRQPPKDKIQATWVGHASFLIQMDDTNILTDPIFSERCSPVQWAGPKRMVAAPLQPAELPNVDFVIISHNHYDHLDTGTVQQLLPKVNKWFVPLGIKSWLVDQGASKDAVIELDWWQEHVYARKDKPDIKVVCTPCQHFSGRTLFDLNTTLWASWSIIGPTRRFFFAGDTGYRSVPKDTPPADEAKLPICPEFKEIGRRFGPFDLSAIPIGAYSPRWFMSPVHLNPEDAVDVHVDVQSRHTIGMHWGTFVLTDEPVEEPPIRLADALKQRGLSGDAFHTLKHGETFAC